ncbi:hypothetical protein FisN_19Lh322 [Fistulifera solaris]|uniref:Sulfotransferase domain-containing protein n=1 Tax=Fistulifera solaris TaxID=1519565 RepID=A0A1Z5K7X5_FISSO|nr:hypothetical protein FisN_19Lh322 [Fistulifera solaris]|eukprot:GAX22252.1 hypothetical protein FisN_19Lh322 [Fistulifera solaris]
MTSKFATTIDEKDLEMIDQLPHSKRLRDPPAPLRSELFADFSESDEVSDKPDSNDDDDENSENSSIDGLAPLSPVSWALLMLPFLLLAMGLGIAYAGRRFDPGQLLGNSNEVDTVSDINKAESPLVYDLHQPQDTSLRGISNRQYNVSATAAEQIRAYRQRDALIIHIEVEYHAGHAICTVLGNYTPGPDCWQLKDLPDPSYPYYYPWLHRDTAANAAVVRSQFDLISWKFNHPPGQVTLSDTNWEHSSVLSIYVARDPMTRMLAYDKKGAELWPAVFGARINPDQAHSQWWAFARSPYTDNFALRALTSSECCRGSHTPKKFLEQAKALLERFSIILDMECLEEGLEAVADLLGLQIALPQKKNQASARERIPEAEVYDFLVAKNSMDIELYEFAKTRSLVQCSSGRKR